MKIFCTMTAAHLLDENLPHKSLKYLAEHILNIPQEDIKEYDEVDSNDINEFGIYAIKDAVWTYKLYQKFASQLEKENLGHLFWDIEMPFQRCLRDLAINGCKVDISASRQMTYDTRHLYYTLEKEMLDMWGGTWEIKCTPRSKKVMCEPTINFNSSDQVIPLIEKLGFKIYEKSKKGKKSWGKRAKKRLAGQHKFIDLLIKFSKVQKLLSSFLEPFEEFIDEDNKVRCNFHNTVAVTGRLSCSCPNLEQLPKNNDIANIRNLFISNSNNIFIVADYSGQELRILGEESQDPALIKAFADGEDLHQATANDLSKLKINRDGAKTVNFGIPYGKGAYGFAQDFNIPEPDAQLILDEYFAKHPRVRARIERCKLGVYKNGYVVNMSGRKRRFPNFHDLNIWGKKRCYRQAFNFLIQSYGADVVKVAAAEIIKDTNLKLVNLVHDEIVIECLKSYVEKGIIYIRECMINAIPMSIPWEVDIGIGERYGEAK